ncbi:NACHT domain-containing protein [Erythrobacter sp. Alg231-14]|uniref:NACHT domain-containing protein n=1 Tax=Erythrobacter sp. Alg231-14 TaxID=1922225 RepID=UPI00307C9141
MTPFETTLATAAVKETAGPAGNAIKKWGVKKWDKFVATYTNVFSENIDRSRKKCETVRNILYRNQLAKTNDKYVSISFKDRNDNDINDKRIIPALLARRRILLKGRGGAGKTMFTKWAVLRLAEDIIHHQQIPIFIELRDLGESDNSTPFERLVFDYISTSRTKPNFNQFLEAVKAGLFIFILDAADEVKKVDRPSICKKIEAFGLTFPECGILLTSRDFTEIDNIVGFEPYKTRPLRRKEAISIIQKLDYDSKVKNALVDLIEDDKRHKHDFFLSNPLLVTILLLTYDQSKEIPTKRSAIYKRAFEALYERHDTSKGIYRRDHHAGLPMDEFETVFATFCFGTYISGKFDFEEGEIVPLFRAACELAKIDEPAEKIAKDAYESACLLSKEGHEFVFCHRSFQEYFVAVFLRDYRGDDLPELIEAALKRGQGENVVEFLYEIDKKDLERHFVLPNLDRIIKSVKRKLNGDSDDARKIVSHFFKNIKMMEKGLSFAGVEFQKNSNAGFLFSLSAVYPELNLFDIIIKFEDSTIKYRSFSIGKAIGTGSYSKSFDDARKQNMITLRFSPTASEWFQETEFHSRTVEFWKDLNSLRDRLSAEYDAEPSNISKRFERFST